MAPKIVGKFSKTLLNIMNPNKVFRAHKIIVAKIKEKYQAQGKRNLIPEKVRKILEEKETSLYQISKPFALTNTKCNRRECNTLHIIL